MGQVGRDGGLFPQLSHQSQEPGDCWAPLFMRRKGLQVQAARGNPALGSKQELGKQSIPLSPSLQGARCPGHCFLSALHMVTDQPRVCSVTLLPVKIKLIPVIRHQMHLHEHGEL